MGKFGGSLGKGDKLFLFRVGTGFLNAEKYCVSGYSEVEGKILKCFLKGEKENKQVLWQHGPGLGHPLPGA